MTSPTMAASDAAVYTRSTTRAKPADYKADEFKSRQIAALFTKFRTMAGLQSFCADASYYQPYFDKTYPWRWANHRLDSGYFIDEKAVGNYKLLTTWPQILVIENYTVFIPSTYKAMLQRIKDFYHTNGLSPKVVVKIDMESGSGFAGPGDHSTDANWLANELADVMGSQERVLRYGNTPDYDACWSHPLAWLPARDCIAGYSSNEPAHPHLTWQYFGGMTQYPSPAGYPRSVAPFGSYIDLNVAHMSVAALATKYGLTTGEELDVTAVQTLTKAINASEAAVQAAIKASEDSLYNRIWATLHTSLVNGFYAILHGVHPTDSVYTRHALGADVIDGKGIIGREKARDAAIAKLEAQVTKIQNEVAALVKKG